jgi:glutathione synthase/RimK-type ligase-like ATP-grasp enzyme
VITSSCLTPFLCHFVNDIRQIDPNSDDIRELFIKDLKEEERSKFSAAEAKVLILSRRLDLESDLVGLVLLSKGIDYLRINVEDIPNEIKVSVHGEEEKLTTTIAKKNQVVTLAKIEVVLMRDFDIDNIDFEVGVDFVNKFMRGQWLDTFASIKEGTSKARWISSFDAIESLQYNKARQLSIAKSVGIFDVPDTLITNDPDQARSFYYNHGGDVIVKGLHHHAVSIKNKAYTINTRRLVDSDFSKLDESLAAAPCIFQKRIEKKNELRITVIRDKVFAAKLNLRSKLALEEDIHLCKSKDDIDIEPFFDLTQDVKNRVLASMRAFGLEYGSLDFIVDKNDKLIFLEVNPTGAWAYIEDATGMPITEAVTNLIMKEKTTLSSAEVTPLEIS